MRSLTSEYQVDICRMRASSCADNSEGTYSYSEPAVPAAPPFSNTVGAGWRSLSSRDSALRREVVLRCLRRITLLAVFDYVSERGRGCQRRLPPPLDVSARGGEGSQNARPLSRSRLKLLPSPQHPIGWRICEAELFSGLRDTEGRFGSAPVDHGAVQVRSQHTARLRSLCRWHV